MTITGRVITLAGVKPQGQVQWKRQNFYLYGVVEPATGDSCFWEFSHGSAELAERLDSVCFQSFLEVFS